MHNFYYDRYIVLHRDKRFIEVQGLFYDIIRKFCDYNLTMNKYSDSIKLNKFVFVLENLLLTEHNWLNYTNIYITWRFVPNSSLEFRLFINNREEDVVCRAYPV